MDPFNTTDDFASLKSPVLCPAFTTGATNSASLNTHSCEFVACEASGSITISSDNKYGGWCQGDQFIRLFDSHMVEVASNDDHDSNNLCSSLTYTVPTGSGCQRYTLKEGCWSSDSCSGLFAVLGGSFR